MNVLLSILFIVGAILMFSRPMEEVSAIDKLKELAWRVFGVIFFVGIVLSFCSPGEGMTGFPSR